MSNGLRVLNDGAPVVVKLQNGDEIIGVLYCDEQSGMLIDKPLQTVRETIGEDENFIRYGTRFEKWVKNAGTNAVPIMEHNVMSIAILTAKMGTVYAEWSARFYAPPPVLIEEEPPTEELEEPDPGPETDAAGVELTEEEVTMRNIYFQHILENFSSNNVH